MIGNNKHCNTKLSFLESIAKDDFGIPAEKVVGNIELKNIVPDQIRDEIPTLNRMGYMKIDLDEFSKEFINYAASTKDYVLELGCAYGFVVQNVLENNGKIIACDLSSEHLEILITGSPKEKLNNLYVYPGSFPDEIEIPNESLGAVLTSRMFHFLNGEKIENGLKKIYSWLKPGGKLFFIVVSPYNVAIKEGFLPIYQQRVKDGDKWPGVIENQWEINPAHKEHVEPYLHVFDIPQLEELLPKYGFKIDKIKLFDFPNEVDGEDNGHVGFVATKI